MRQPIRARARAARGRGRIRPAGRGQVTHQLAPAQPDPGPGGNAPVPAPPVNMYDFSADPILQTIQGQSQQRQAEAEASALAARKQLAIDFGDPSLAPDEATRQAALANPFSRRALFEKQAAEQPKQLTQQLSQQNLGYSSAGAKQQSDLATQLLGEQAAMQGEARGRLSDIDQQRRGTLSGIQDALVQAQQDAAGRLRDRLGDLSVRQPRARRQVTTPGGAGHVRGGRGGRSAYY